MPSPEFTAKADQLHSMGEQLFNYYVDALEHDMNEYAKKYGKPPDSTFAHTDLTKILVNAPDLGAGNLAAILAYAILDKIRSKTGGSR